MTCHQCQIIVAKVGHPNRLDSQVADVECCRVGQRILRLLVLGGTIPHLSITVSVVPTIMALPLVAVVVVCAWSVQSVDCVQRS